MKEKMIGFLMKQLEGRIETITSAESYDELHEVQSMIYDTLHQLKEVLLP